MTSNWWNFSNSSDMAGFSDSQPFPTNISSYFRRPAKIIKPIMARNQSPRNSSRRRMTTQFPARTRSVAEAQRTNRMSQWTMKSQSQPRPTSWHPSPMNEFNPNEFTHSHFFEQPMTDYTRTTPFNTTNVNGLITPMSFPVHDEPQIQELITPLEELSAQEMDHHYFNAQQNMNPFWQPQQAKAMGGDFHSMTNLNSQSQMWWPSQQYNIPNVATAPTSPDFLPMPDMGDPFTLSKSKQQPPKDDLVGMGLYDSPADVQSASLLFGGNQGSIGRKSLKLEESFEPIAALENDEDEEDENEAEEDAESEDDENKEMVGSDSTLQQPVVAMYHQYPNMGLNEAQFEPYYPTQVYGNSDGQWAMNSYPGYGWI